MMVVMNRHLIGEIQSGDRPAWVPFSLDLPELAEREIVDIAIRTSQFRPSRPPDERVLGMILSDFRIEVDGY